MSRGISDKITYKPYNQGEQWLLPPSLDELVPQNHFIRIVSKIVDELEIEEVFARNTKVGGASRYNPFMLLKVLIYCHMTGTYSSRQKKPLLGLFVGAFSTAMVIGFVSADVAMTIIWIPLLKVMEKNVTNLVKDEKKEKIL